VDLSSSLSLQYKRILWSPSLLAVSEVKSPTFSRTLRPPRQAVNTTYVMTDLRGPAKYTGSEPENLEAFFRQFIRHCTALKMDWVIIWESSPPAVGLKANALTEIIQKQLVICGKETTDESAMKGLKRTMEVCACSSLRNFLGGQALA
jgi:hypothetical protein